MPSFARPHLPLRAVAATLCAALAATGVALASGSRPPGHASTVARVTGMASPDGANDFGCRPRAQHPRPVVLVHGTFNNMRQTWSTLSPRLAAAGYCVF